jgi:tRNA dimethylallyltransferase
MEELGLEYRSLARYLRKIITKEEMIAELNRDIRRYAKKQMMYWKRNPDIMWFDSPNNARIVPTVRAWLKK